jgi:hydrogenase-4 component E
VSGPSFSSALTLFVGAVLVCAVAVLWLSALRAVVRVVAVQGLALGAVAATLGLHLHDAGLVATAVVVVGIKAIVIPLLLRRVGSTSEATAREQRPLVNVPASLVVSGALILLAFASTHVLARVVGGTPGSLVPVGFATLLVGFFVLVARRRPIFQIVGLLLVDNGIALVAFLVTAGVPFLIELGVTLDVLLGVVVLMVLAQRLRHEYGDVDLDELQELHD